MLDRDFLRPILDDESLTRGLGDEEARLLVDWLVDWAERLATSRLSEGNRRERLVKLCRRGRAVARFVSLWCHERRCGAATQLAGAEAFPWDLPVGAEDPGDLMARILHIEERSRAAAA